MQIDANIDKIYGTSKYSVQINSHKLQDVTLLNSSYNSIELAWQAAVQYLINHNI